MAVFGSLQRGMTVRVSREIDGNQQRNWRFDGRALAAGYLRGAEMKVVDFTLHPQTRKRLVLLQPLGMMSYPSGSVEECFGVPEGDFDIFFE